MLIVSVFVLVNWKLVGNVCLIVGFMVLCCWVGCLGFRLNDVVCVVKVLLVISVVVSKWVMCVMGKVWFFMFGGIFFYLMMCGVCVGGGLVMFCVFCCLVWFFYVGVVLSLIVVVCCGVGCMMGVGCFVCVDLFVYSVFGLNMCVCSGVNVWKFYRLCVMNICCI